MEPYVVRQGDYLAKLAYQFGFDAGAIWNDGKNAQLRELRPNQNILNPTDILYIPNQADKTPVTQSLSTGTTNAFVSDPPTVNVAIRFLDAPFASQAYSVAELPQLVGLTTGQDGTATLSIPITLDSFTIAFTESGMSFAFDVGCLDPIDTLSGIFQRLQNLGYIDPDAASDPPDMDVMRAALRAFKAASQDASSSPPSSSDGGASSQESTDSADDSSDDADTSSDDAGLTDDGKLDDATSNDLVTAHCC